MLLGVTDSQTQYWRRYRLAYGQPSPPTVLRGNPFASTYEKSSVRFSALKRHVRSTLSPGSQNIRAFRYFGISPRRLRPSARRLHVSCLDHPRDRRHFRPDHPGDDHGGESHPLQARSNRVRQSRNRATAARLRSAPGWPGSDRETSCRIDRPGRHPPAVSCV